MEVQGWVEHEKWRLARALGSTLCTRSLGYAVVLLDSVAASIGKAADWAMDMLSKLSQGWGPRRGHCCKPNTIIFPHSSSLFP